MLAALGVDRLDLLSNNPDKAAQLRDLGIPIRDRVPTGVHATPHNLRYLRAKSAGTDSSSAHDLLVGRIA